MIKNKLSEIMGRKRINMIEYGMDEINLNHFANDQESIITKLKKACTKYNYTMSKQEKDKTLRGC